MKDTNKKTQNRTERRWPPLEPAIIWILRHSRSAARSCGGGRLITARCHTMCCEALLCIHVRLYRALEVVWNNFLWELKINTWRISRAHYKYLEIFTRIWLKILKRIRNCAMMLLHFVCFSAFGHKYCMKISFIVQINNINIYSRLYVVATFFVG